MRIPREIIEEIVYRSDIEQIIGSYVSLKRAGSGLVGLCPFHSEKTPSFSVNVKDKFFYCFGCGAGGDVITFIMRAENLDYVGAVEFLAARAGITIETEHSDRGQNDGVSRKRILDMNLEAARFFRSQLFDPKVGVDALKYLTEERKLPPAIIKRFGLGYSPNDFGRLTDHMHKCGFTDEELIVGFLCGKSTKTGRAYDYFRNRVMFPIIDARGDIVAFGGRVMDDSKPKYLNSSDTPSFKKSRTLFALNYARAKCADELILCEGYMDVIALHAAGFENAVATLGTAITPEHARLMAKYTKKVLISYDSDSAGQNAADKAMRLLAEVGLDVRVIQMTGAKDPDEFIKKFGRDKFKSVLAGSKSGFEYKMDAILSKYDVNRPDELIKASNELTTLISQAYSGVEREIYISIVSDKLGLSKDSLKNDVERKLAAARRERKLIEGRQAQASAMNLGDRINPEAATNVQASAAEDAILGMLLLYGEHRKAVASGSPALSADDFVTSFAKRAFEAIMELENSSGGFMFSLLGQSFSAEEVGRLTLIEQKRREVSGNDLSILTACIDTLKELHEDSAENDWMQSLRLKQNKAKQRRDGSK